MTTNNNTLPLLASYTPGQIEFIKFLQTNRAALTVYDIAVPAWIAAAKTRRAGRGNYLIPELAADVATLTVNGNKRGRKPGSPNQKGRISAPTTATPPSAPALATTTA